MSENYMSENAYPIDTSADAEAVSTIRGRLPVQTNSITNFDPDQIRQDAADARIIVHHKFPALVEEFLQHKREHGSAIEKAFYGTPKTWSVEQQIARLVEERALVFMNSDDHTLLRDGRSVSQLYKEWDRVGTDAEVTSKYLTLREYLSYDEMMLGSLLGVSGPSYFINEGRRYNAAKAGKPGTFENRGIIIGLVGARFERADRMDSVFCEPPVASPRQHHALSTIFANCFGRRINGRRQFNHSMYKARMRITVDLLLREANERAKTAGKNAYVHVVGLGLGVWQVDGEQPEAYLEAFMDALDGFGAKMQNIGTLNFAYINVNKQTEDATKAAARPHGIDVIFSRREPAATLPPEKKNELLVLSYAWDSNAYPGNEYWEGSLVASGDPAAACMSTISELHNSILNPQFLSKIQVLGP
ncbi:hypothetical protein SCAR479_12869 [Seiridium cardinale]|uniref:Uncharacterized protein n=1 Tax=Seiridium cardinale TaxID=138064 RepID=A0ABR2X9R7_9PEZI